MMYSDLSSQILFSQLHVRSFKSFGAAVEWLIIVRRIVIILWGVRVECRICKWKLLSVDRAFVAAFAQLTSFRDVGSSFSYVILFLRVVFFFLSQ